MIQPVGGSGGSRSASDNFAGAILGQCLSAMAAKRPQQGRILPAERALEIGIEMERQIEIRGSANDLLLVERAREWLLKDVGP
jgi:hypothetical protein